MFKNSHWEKINSLKIKLEELQKDVIKFQELTRTAITQIHKTLDDSEEYVYDPNILDPYKKNPGLVSKVTHLEKENERLKSLLNEVIDYVYRKNE